MKIHWILILLIVMQSCFPNFDPKEETVKEIQQESISLKWVNVIGIIDQDFPDYILMKKGSKSDTICISHNIADLKMIDCDILIGFYGMPIKYSEPISIPKDIFGYNIIIDTSYAKK
jgi:hypothetical protein